MNLPNSISAARIVAAPILATMAFVPHVGVRALAFVLYLITAISDHIDGKIARSRGLVTDLGKVLDPLADKLLLVATFVPMFLLQAPPGDPLLAFLPTVAERSEYPFITWGVTGGYFPWWVLVPIVGREAFMTWFRGFAQKRGVVIAAQSLGKFKAGFQYTWMGASFFWFGLSLFLTQGERWTHTGWMVLARTIGGIGILTMYVALALTLLSLGDYLVRHGKIFFVRR